MARKATATTRNLRSIEILLVSGPMALDRSIIHQMRCRDVRVRGTAKPVFVARASGIVAGTTPRPMRPSPEFPLVAEPRAPFGISEQTHHRALGSCRCWGRRLGRLVDGEPHGRPGQDGHRAPVPHGWLEPPFADCADGCVVQGRDRAQHANARHAPGDVDENLQ